jgi:signal transduction histidine kinase
MGYAEMALKDPENPSLLTKRIGHILTAGARARELIRQILTFSRQNEHRVEPVIMNHILEETLRLIQATVPGTITIKTRNDAPAGMIMADPTQIHQVILNLCTNAIQSMGNNRGELMASLNTVVLNGAAVRFQPPLKPGKYVQLTIRDTGQGMSPDIVDRIFDPFFTTKKPGDGTGMGLSVVHGIVKSLQGSIAVHSEYGKGSIFDVYIPAADSHIGQPGVSHRIDAVAVEPKMLSGQCEH